MVQKKTAAPGKDKTQGKPRTIPVDKPKDITVMGLEFTLDPSVLDDLDVMGWMYDLQHVQEDSANAFDFIPLLRRITGRSIHDIKQAIKDPSTGRAGSEQVTAFMQQVLEAVAPKS